MEVVTDPFVKISVDLLDNPKVMGLPAPAFRLYVLGLVAAGRGLTDGLLKVSSMLGETSANVRTKNRLVEAGLWHNFGHSCERCPNPPAPVAGIEYVYIHDYLEHQQSRSDVEKRRRTKSQAGKAGAAARWGKPPSETPPGPMADAMAPANGRRNGRTMAERWPEPEPEVDPAKSRSQVVPFPLQSPDF